MNISRIGTQYQICTMNRIRARVIIVKETFLCKIKNESDYNSCNTNKS